MSASAASSSAAAPPEPLPQGQVEGKQEKWRVLARLKATDYPKTYVELSKAKLAGLVALTTMAGYAIAPGALQLGTVSPDR